MKPSNRCWSIFFMACALMMATCTTHQSQEESAQELMEEPAAVLASFSPDRNEVAEPHTATVRADPYVGHGEWCEPLYYKPCETKADCEGVEHPAGWDLKCVKRWTDGANVCAPGYDGSGRWRSWRRDRLREIVREQYFEEASLCEPDARVVDQNWRCQQEAHKGEQLADFLWLVYYRETTGRPWKRHRLNPDARANRTAWGRHARRYGWKLHFNKQGSVTQFERLAHDANEHYIKEERWQFGLGPYGMNAAGWTASWDAHAPPEILCKEVESTEAYLRRARQVWRKIKGGIDCDRDGEVEFSPEPTLGLIHRGASGGRICPPKGRDIVYKPGFLKRMRRMGLDPDRVVPLSFFGEPIERETQNERAAEIYEVLEETLSEP